VTREDRDSHQTLEGTVRYSLLWETIAITEGQSPPKEVYPFCHLTAVAGFAETESRVLPLWQRNLKVVQPGLRLGEQTAHAVLCGLRKGPCLGYHRVLTLRRARWFSEETKMHMGLACIEHGPRLGAAPNLKGRRKTVRAAMLVATHSSNDRIANMLSHIG
jgi:hypothetical protein